MDEKVLSSELIENWNLRIFKSTFEISKYEDVVELLKCKQNETGDFKNYSKLTERGGYLRIKIEILRNR